MLRRCCCIVNVTLFSRVTLIRKLQSTSDLDHFHARDLRCSRVKFRDDPTVHCRVDSAVPYSFIDISDTVHERHMYNERSIGNHTWLLSNVTYRNELE